MSRRRPIPDLSDDGLMDLLCEAHAVMEPVPQYVRDQASAFSAAHELRQGGIPVTALPDQTPGGRRRSLTRPPSPVTKTTPGSGLARLKKAARIAAGLVAFALAAWLAWLIGLFLGLLALLYLT